MGPQDSPAKPISKRPWRPVVASTAIAAILVVSGLAVYWTVASHSPSNTSQPPPPVGWTTYRLAWASISAAFTGIANGSWTLRFAEGAVASSKWSPPAVLWAETNPVAWQSCASQISGISTLSFWNDSFYPNTSSPTVFTSGAAPLWTFAFNGSGTPTFVASWFSGRVLVNAALPPTSPCFDPASGLNRVFSGLPFQTLPLVNYVDSNAVAASAFKAGLLPPDRPGQFVLYFPAEQVTPDRSYGGAIWNIYTGSCGSAGELGSMFNLTNSYYNATTAAWYGATGESTFVCADSYYLLNLTQTPFAPPANSTGLYREWNLSWSFLSSAVPTTWTNSSLSTSMLHLWADGGGVPSGAVCTVAASNLSSCLTPAVGWYAVLVGPTGALLDSYPTIANGTSWSVPGVIISPADHLLLVGAPGLPLTTFLRTQFDTEPLVFGWPG